MFYSTMSADEILSASAELRSRGGGGFDFSRAKNLGCSRERREGIRKESTCLISRFEVVFEELF